MASGGVVVGFGYGTGADMEGGFSTRSSRMISSRDADERAGAAEVLRGLSLVTIVPVSVSLSVALVSEPRFGTASAGPLS
jgi:hypothetical protein